MGEQALSVFLQVLVFHVKLKGFYRAIISVLLMRDPLISCGDPVIRSPFPINIHEQVFFIEQTGQPDIEMFIYFKIQI
jgi:hypothetical protein